MLPYSSSCWSSSATTPTRTVPCLVLLEFFGDNPNPDGSVPSKRFAGLWRKLYEDGEVTRQFDNKRFAWIRNRVSDMGGIEWEDATYSMGVGDGKGKAAKWRASEELQAMMRELAGDGAATCGEVRMSVYDNNQRKLGGSKASGIESLWQEMLLANARNVGLRPVRVSARAKTWDWLDHLGELEALGLSGLAA